MAIDSVGNSLCHAITPDRSGHLVAIIGIGQISHFDQDRGNNRRAQNHKIGRPLGVWMQDIGDFCQLMESCMGKTNRLIHCISLRQVDQN